MDTIYDVIEKENKPVFIMNVGIPGSGKSTYVKGLADKGVEIVSADDIRKSILGCETYPEDPKVLKDVNTKTFMQVTEKVCSALKSGRSAVLDSTGLTRKRRLQALRDVYKIKCLKVCLVFVTPVEVCKARNAKRTGFGLVPDEVIDKMLGTFEFPMKEEGWDMVIPVICDIETKFDFEKAKVFSQDNPHHTLDLYGHLEAAYNYAKAHDYPEWLQKVAMYHDVGKLYTKTFRNFRGEVTSIAHFYGHENYSAYLYVTEFCCGRTLDDDELNKIIYQTCLINAHMRPLTVWENQPNCRKKDKEFYGEQFVNDLELLNNADKGK